MQRNNLWVLLLAALSGGLCASAQAQQLKPYFLVIVDTSGSMAWCAAATQAGKLGVPGADDCSCHTDTTNCNSPFKTNRCGFDSNKLGDARCSLQRIIDGTGGDAVFGLMQFEHPCSATCGNSSVTNTGTACGLSCTANDGCDDGQLLVDIKDGNDTAMRTWVDGTCQGSCTNSYTQELTAGVWTPIAKSLTRANEYLRATTAPTDGFLYPTNPAGFNVAPLSPLLNDKQLACRPVSVILLTDGNDTCAGNPNTDPPNAAAVLNTGDPRANNIAGKAFRTYVIGFGSSGGNFDPTVLSNIAASGGTDSHDPAGKYFPASNEAQLSVALNQIIADSQPPVEICNNLDDDCDGKVDEGLPKFCDKPHGINDETLCTAPPETVCDGKDDNCNGVIDEGLTNACGVCGPLMPEICDGIDNDCDGRVDEGTDTQASCGNAKGECKPGKLECTDGKDTCEGEIGPTPEVCDCKDNDCDGVTDEDGTPALCPAGQKCAGCKCVQFCTKVSEFTAMCPPGLATEFEANGECLCITDTCDHTACPASTIERDGTAACAPGNPQVSACICQAGMCVPRCDGVSCDSGQTCSPKTGRCVEDNCRGLGCATGELCDPVQARCVQDSCANKSCPDGQACRGGNCEPSCAKVKCASTDMCQAGSCVTNPCAGIVCDNSQVCDPTSGQCGTDRCANVGCADQQSCSPSSGECEAQPCWNVTCPKGQVCVAGECALGGATPPPTAGSAAPASAPGNRIATTGGGGCSCSVPGLAPTGTDLRGLWLSLAGLSMFLLRSRRRRGLVTRTHLLRVLSCASVGVALAAVSGCRVSSLCLDCVDAGKASSNADGAVSPAADSGSATTVVDASTDAGVNAGDAEVDGSTNGDGGVPKCTPTGDEVCNGKDDDCDFKVDEDVTPTTNNCTQLGVCAGTVPVCSGGNFVCRYPTTYEPMETLCDGLDNDCNGKVDESFKDLGTTCDVGVGACHVSGNWRCNGTGTGLVCDVKSVIMPGEEVCNGKDDDCDGMVDEPKATPGSNPSYVKDDVVKLKDNLWMYAYEASRSDADANSQGIISTRSCSRPGVQPWTNVTYTEAAAACSSVGMTLCNLSDWISACNGSAGTCNWSFTPSTGDCNTYTTAGSKGCNGHDITATATTGDHDALLATGAKPQCYADFMSAGKVFDLSGNAKEWTVGAMSPSQNPLRGGAYNDDPVGLRCDFDFTLGAPDTRLPSVGFRCCTTSQP